MTTVKERVKVRLSAANLRGADGADGAASQQVGDPHVGDFDETKHPRDANGKFDAAEAKAFVDFHTVQARDVAREAGREKDPTLRHMLRLRAEHHKHFARDLKTANKAVIAANKAGMK